MSHPNDLTRLHEFIVAHLDREELRTLCFNLGVDYDSLPAEGKAAKARELILVLGRDNQLEHLLDVLRQARPASWPQDGFTAHRQSTALLYAQLPAFARATSAAPKAYRSRPLHSTPPTYVEPRRPRRKQRAVAIAVILIVVLSLTLSILIQPWGEPSSSEPASFSLGGLILIAQAIVSFIAVLAAMAELSGWNVRELFSTRPAGASTEAFPFYVVRDFDELLDHLFPDPTAPLLPDRAVTFLPRIAAELEGAFRQRGRILLCGISKTGKSREAVELLRRWWRTGPTVLLARHHVGLYPPYAVPDTLPIRNLVLFFDDLDRYCGDDAAVERLDQTIAFFADRCHDPGELRVIATARQEPTFWDKLRYDETKSPWTEFKLLSLPPLSPADAQGLIDDLVQVSGIDIDPTVAQDMARKNDGTFLNLVLSFRGWLDEGMRRAGPEQVDVFEGELATTWRRRYERLVRAMPEAGPIYAAVDMLQRLDVPLRPALITELAAEMSASRTYHLLYGLLHVMWHKLNLSPKLNRYRGPHRRRWLALTSLLVLLMLYACSYLLWRFVPVDVQFKFINRLAAELWLQLLLLTPLLLLLIPQTLLLTLRWSHRRGLRSAQTALERLLEIEVPLRGDELRPYENQFEGNGTSRAWRPVFFAGQGDNAAFRRLAAPRLAAVYWGWAEALRAAGEWGPARALAELARVLAPTHPTPPFLLGQLWHDEGVFSRALVEFEHSRALNSTISAAQALERAAWCLYRLGAFERAESAARDALILIPTLSTARWAQGLARLQRGQTQAGLADCRQAALAVQAPPPDLAAVLETALTAKASQGWASWLSRLVQQDKSLSKKRTALQRRVMPGLVVGLVLASVIATLLGVPYLVRKEEQDYNFSLRLMNVLLRLYPQAPSLLTQRGQAYVKLGDPDQAIADVNKAIRLDPNSAAIYASRGYAYVNMGNYEHAIVDCTEAIRLDPDLAQVYNAYNNRGLAYAKIGKYELAIADYTEAIRLDPDFATAYHDRGFVYHKISDYAHAIADYTEAIRLDPGYDVAYHNRGYTYNKLGDYERAIADYTEAIRLNPEDAVTYTGRGDVYREMGELIATRADWERAIELYEAQGQLDEAQKVRGWLAELGD